MFLPSSSFCEFLTLLNINEKFVFGEILNVKIHTNEQAQTWKESSNRKIIWHFFLLLLLMMMKDNNDDDDDMICVCD